MQEFNSPSLYVFAHRGEAQAMLQAARPCTFFFEGLFAHPTLGAILVCGEGLHSAREKVAAVLAAYPELARVINYGVCAGLRKELEQASFHSIRTVYAEGEFKSYTSHDSCARMDLISARERILDAELALQLDNFAPLADRELWAIAGVATLFHKEWFSYKIISDIPAAEGQSQIELCHLVKEQAQQWAEAFYEHALREPGHRPLPSQSELTSELNPEFFHLTASLEKKLTTLMSKVSDERRQEIIKMAKGSDFSRPKDRSLFLVHALQSELNPFKAKLEDALAKVCSPLSTAGIKISYPWPLENPHLGLKCEIQSPKDLERIKLALQEFSFADFEQLIETGKFDV